MLRARLKPQVSRVKSESPTYRAVLSPQIAISMILLYDVYSITRALFKWSSVNLQGNTQNEELQAWTIRFYGYQGTALIASLATGLIGLVLLSSFVRYLLGVRFERRVVSVLTLRTGCTALRKRAEPRAIPLISPSFDVFHLVWTVFHCSASKECNRDIPHRPLNDTFANCSASRGLPPYS